MERNISVIKDVNGKQIVVMIAKNKRFRKNLAKKHDKNARFG